MRILRKLSLHCRLMKFMLTGWNDFDFHMYTLAPENQETYQLTARPWGGVCAVPQFY